MIGWQNDGILAEQKGDKEKKLRLQEKAGQKLKNPTGYIEGI